MLSPRLTRILNVVALVVLAPLFVVVVRRSAWVPAIVLTLIVAVLVYGILAAPIRQARLDRMHAIAAERAGPGRRPSFSDVGWNLMEFRATEDPTHRRRLWQYRLVALATAAACTGGCALVVHLV